MTSRWTPEHIQRLNLLLSQWEEKSSMLWQQRGHFSDAAKAASDELDICVAQLRQIVQRMEKEVDK